MTESIIFESREYIIRNIEIPIIGKVKVAPTALNSAIMKENGSYKSDKARVLDESIYYFVESSEILYSNKKLITLIAQIL